MINTKKNNYHTLDYACEPASMLDSKCKTARAQKKVVLFKNVLGRVHGAPWFFFFLILFYVSFDVFAQRDDSEVAQQYVKWIQKAIDENRMDEAIAALNRTKEFADVSSDISYLFVSVNYIKSKYPLPDQMARTELIEHLNKAIEVNKWIIYSENQALLCKAELLIALRKYFDALSCLDRISRSGELASNAKMRADTAMQRLLALRGMTAGNTIGADPVQALALFRSEVLLAMDRFPRDPRPLRIFFEFARNRLPEASELPPGDLELLELALRRLPFLLEIDPDLAWMAAPFVYNLEDARRLVGAYRAENPQPSKNSIPIALNLGLIDDDTAIEELFSDSEYGSIRLDKEVIIDSYKFLRREEGRELFSQRLHSFSGQICNDIDNDGFIDNFVKYDSGELKLFTFDMDQDFSYEFSIVFNDGVPKSAVMILQNSRFEVLWERFPFIGYADLANRISAYAEVYIFGPANFNYAPIKLIEIGGSQKISSLFYPEPVLQYIDITRQALISSCSSITRSSLEIENAIETIYMNRGVILQVVEVLGDRQVSVTEFEKGLPVIQHIDLDLDGRMETIRRFRKPPQDYVWQDLLDYRRLVASSESDWSGDGKNKTREVYQLDGSVVYSFDMDGSGEMNHSETGNKK